MRCADLVTVRLDSVRTAGAGQVPRPPSSRPAPPTCRTSWSAGEVVVADGVHLRVPDVGRALADSIAARAAVSTLITNIGQLVTNDPGLGDGGLLGLVDGRGARRRRRVGGLGRPAAQAPAADDRVDVDGRAVVPGFVDSHAHLVFAGDRARRVRRADGRRSPYSAGGIRSTVAATRAAATRPSSATLVASPRRCSGPGTTTVESKSGYGLTVEDEARSLGVARRITDETTYLGAHVVPPEYEGRRDDYVALVAGAMLDACAPHARWVDVFCDRGRVRRRRDPHDPRGRQPPPGCCRGCTATSSQHGPGVRVAVELGAASVDHCTHLAEADVDALAGVRDRRDAAARRRSSRPARRTPTRVACSTRARSSRSPPTATRAPRYTTSMPLCIALAVREMRMTPAEALWSATAGGAKALRRSDVGRLAVGARADLIVLDAPSYIHLAYRPGVPLVRTVLQPR